MIFYWTFSNVSHKTVSYQISLFQYASFWWHDQEEHRSQRRIYPDNQKDSLKISSTSLLPFFSMSSKKGGFPLFGNKKTAAAEMREKLQADITASTEDLSRKFATAEEREKHLDSAIAKKKAEARATATTNKRKGLAIIKRIKALEKQWEQVWLITDKLQALLDGIQ
jgi:hypothetical protein